MIREATPSWTADLAPLAVCTTAVGLLVSRIWLPVLGSGSRPAGLAAVLLGILVVSLMIPLPSPRSSARLHRAPVLAVGLAAIGIALVAGGRPLPAPLVAWAVPLTLLAAVAEEALFRRAMNGVLERRSAIVAIGVSAVAFALVHVPLYGVAAFPVDLGAGLVLSWQRWASGSWAVPAATHATANLAMTVLR